MAKKKSKKSTGNRFEQEVKKLERDLLFVTQNISARIRVCKSIGSGSMPKEGERQCFESLDRRETEWQEFIRREVGV